MQSVRIQPGLHVTHTVGPITHRTVLLGRHGSLVRQVIHLRHQVQRRHQGTLYCQHRTLSANSLGQPLLKTSVTNLQVNPSRVGQPNTKLTHQRHQPQFTQVFGHRPNLHTILVRRQHNHRFDDGAVRYRNLRVVFEFGTDRRHDRQRHLVTRITFMKGIITSVSNLSLEVLRRLLNLPNTDILTRLRIRLYNGRKHTRRRNPGRWGDSRVVTIRIIRIPKELTRPH